MKCFLPPGVAEFISGVIMQDETIRQKSSDGTPLVQVLSRQGILPGIKVDTGAKPLAGAPGETVTEGLDGLRDRLSEYRDMGARFAKWRAVIHISDALPSRACISANAHALARYAALCQEQNLVPIVEPEVLMDGSHSIERCEEVTGAVLHAVFSALHDQRVWLERMLLKPNMVIAGKEWPHPAQFRKSPPLLCAACVATSLRQCRASCSYRVARRIGRPRSIWTQSIDLPGTKPWKISFSYGRALQDHALETWHGRDENLEAARQALYQRARCNSAASLGRYTDQMEDTPLSVASPPHRREWHDD